VRYQFFYITLPRFTSVTERHSDSQRDLCNCTAC